MNARSFSRYLPPLPTARMGVMAWLAVAGLLAGFAALIYDHPRFVLGCLSLLVVGGWIGGRIDARRKRLLAASRPGDPLCAFARAIELRTVDPWVVRAVFEELQASVPDALRPFPIRPDDRLEKDLRIDPEDVDFIADDVATRAGYSLECCEQNPLLGRVETVGDLVRFFNHQPKTRRVEPAR